MKMRCPHCGVSGSVDDAYMGRTLSCPKCSTKFKAVPDRLHEQPVQSVPVPELEKTVPKQPAATETVDTASIAEEAVAAESLPDEGLKEAPQADQQEGMPAAPAVAAEVTHHKGPGREEKPGHGTYPAGRDDETVGLPVIGSLKEAWRQTKGVKGQIWLAILVNVLILLVMDGVISGLAWLIPEGNVNIGINVIGQTCSAVVSTILTAGLIYMGVKRLKGQAISWQDLFSGFGVAGTIFITWLLSIILIFIGYVLLILPGIYLTVGYCLALPLVVDKKMSPWQALETSRKAIHKVWWRFFALMLLLMLITIIAVIPFGIGLIWVAPMSVVLIGVVYKTIIPDRNFS